MRRPSERALTVALLLLCCCSPHVEALLASAVVPQLGRGRAALLTTRRLAHHPTASGAVSQAAVVAAPTNGTGGSDGGLLLMTSYDATIRLLLDEIAATTAGDQIFLQLYLLEGGASSEAVLAALEEAGARRGVRVTFVLDVSYVSMLSRLTEKTTTLIPRVEDLATTQPGWCSCTYGSKPDHSKYALFLRGEGGEGGGSSALLGGMNIGDRFSAWRDFVVRLPSPFAEELQASLGLEMAASSTEGGKGRAEALAVVTPLAAAVIFVTLGTFALAPPLAAAAAATSAPSATVAALYAAVAVAAVASAARGVAAPMTIAMSSLFAALSAAPLLVAAGALAPGADAASVGGAFAAAAAVAALFSATLGAASSRGRYDFSPSRELVALARAATYDRSALGDALAPLRAPALPSDRPFAPPRAAAAAAAAAATAAAAAPAEAGQPRERRYLDALSIEAEVCSLGESPYLDCSPVQFCANRRALDRYEIEPAFRALFADETLTHYRVAMAYLGPRWGIELIELALRRGAHVELLLPARANVYAHANLLAAQRLLDGNWPNLRLRLDPEMMHAKATLARDADGRMTAFLGSANLVRGSMNLPVWLRLLPFDELNVLVRDPAFCARLDGAMDELFERAQPVEPAQRLVAASDWYSARSAWLDELWQ